MIPASLTAPINYEDFYSSADRDDVQRFNALSVMLLRLKEAGWLSEKMHSVHLIDWDWRSGKPVYNHRHVPMIIRTSLVFDWYREYGAFIRLDEKRADRFSFARFFFELAPRRDIVIIRFDLTGRHLFRFTRAARKRTAAEGDGDSGAAYVPETLTIHVNRKQAQELCRPLDGLLAPFRERYPADHRPEPGKIISLAETIGNLGGPVSSILKDSEEARVARDLYSRLPDHAFEAEHLRPARLLHSQEAMPWEQSSEVTPRDIRVLLANVAMHAYLVPDSLQESLIAIVPGIAQIEAGKPMAAGGFLLHYDGPNPHATLDEWALLAMSWAGEKATRDLAERARELTKAHEQRQALAFANHVLKTPLLEAKAIADALPGNVQARAAILHVLEQLLDLEHFVKLALRHQKEVRFVTRSIPEFVAEVTFFLERLCRIFENPEVSDYAAMAGHVAKGRSLLEAAHDGRELPVLQDGGAVRWSRRQLFSVMDGLLTNALKYNVPGPQACLKVFLDSDHDRVFLNVSSASAIGGDSLLGLVADLNRGGNTDWIGVHLIHEATRACEGFAGPQWIALPDGIADGTPLIAARVQVAELTAGAP